MSRRDLTNVAASVHARLKNVARTSDRTFNELLQYYAMERFLYRLSRSPHADADTQTQWQAFVRKGRFERTNRSTDTGLSTTGGRLLDRRPTVLASYAYRHF